MDWQGKAIRTGTWAVILAICLRLWSNGVPGQLMSWLRRPETVSALLYLETGMVIRPPPDKPAPSTDPTVPNVPTEAPTDPPLALPVFTPEDGELVYVRDTSGNTADIAALLETTLSWDLTASASVLIYHTHATESYTQASGEVYTESGDFRTLDTGYNMVSIGAALTQLLTDGGIGVVHNQTLHDYPSYDGGYDLSRQTVRDALAAHPGIRLALDLHRDAAVDAQGNQFTTTAWVDGRESARIMFLIGTDHPHWQENMALAAKLTVLLERMYPGITRGIVTRTYDYNQDLSQGALLVEIGAAGDSREKALVATEALARAILLLAQGTQ